MMGQVMVHSADGIDGRVGAAEEVNGIHLGSAGHAAMEETTIGHGEHMEGFQGRIDAHAKWTIINMADGRELMSGVGEALLDFKFETPGTYQVELDDHHPVEPGGCEHRSALGRIMVHVEAVRMEFELDRLTFSRPLIGGQPTEGIKLRVPVKVVIYDGGTADFPIPSVHTAGVGTTVVARSVSPHTTLTTGEQVIEYELSGQAEHGSYIMFDLVDINGRVIGYPYKEMIH